MLRSAISAFTRVFDALCPAAWCAADPGPIQRAWVPALRSSATRCTASGTRTLITEIFDHQSRNLRNGITGRCALTNSTFAKRVSDAPPRLTARLCACLLRPGADAGAEHDLSDLALDHARTGGRHRFARRRRAWLCVLHAVRGVRHQRTVVRGALCLRRAAARGRGVFAVAGVAGAETQWPLAVSGEETPRRWTAQIVCDGLLHQSPEPEDRNAVPCAAAAIHRSR